MAGLGMFIDKAIEGKLKSVHTLLLAKVERESPLVVIPLFGGKSGIENPMVLDEKTFRTGDVVLIAILEEFAEGGRIRRFDLSDAVVLGKVSNL